MLALSACIALVVGALGYGAFRLLRNPSVELPSRSSAAGWIFGQRREQRYVPDAGDLTREIISGMVQLGFKSLTEPIRILDTNVLVTGTAEDIATLQHFDPNVRAEVVNFVRKNGSKYRWALSAEPTLTYQQDPEAIHGHLMILRAPSPAADGRGATQGFGPAGAETIVTQLPPPGQSQAGPGSRRISTRRIEPGRNGAGQTGSTGAATVRLFRIGGGNVYHLSPGPNMLGRDQHACNIVCAYDKSISNVHLELTVTDAEVTARDAGSTNGTKINGRDLVGTEPLHHLDELQVGETRLRVAIGSAGLGPTQAVSTGP